ncbi:hypothetical protein [Leptonema illini]|uniref:Uncharacterized protein n=1 Tax=Leptonema illini DSM 21528 TaxID=929563 RepID=H2CKG8_9LEPT|nr:hypothetical protein [Leptonema illini]EHQ08273.1 hypothetical protein Lepil_3616 [Leptonema illini DSM 21528]
MRAFSGRIEFLDNKTYMRVSIPFRMEAVSFDQAIKALIRWYGIKDNEVFKVTIADQPFLKGHKKAAKEAFERRLADGKSKRNESCQDH